MTAATLLPQKHSRQNLKKEKRRHHEHNLDQRWDANLIQGLGQASAERLSHGWPLSADDWDAQMMFFLDHGYRVIAHDRRGHGRSSQPGDGHDLDHYADDLAAFTAHLDLKDAIHGRDHRNVA